MSAWKRLLLDGRLVFAVAGCGSAFLLVTMSVARPRGARDQLLVIHAVLAAGMALVLGWALASVRRGPAEGRLAAGAALVLSLAGVVYVAVELARHILRPSPL